MQCSTHDPAFSWYVSQGEGQPAILVCALCLGDAIEGEQPHSLSVDAIKRRLSEALIDDVWVKRNGLTLDE